MSQNTTVGQRFTQLINHLGLSKNAFATSLDKTATVIQHLVDERNKPGFDLLCKVFEVYPQVSKDWLLQGSGPMLQEQEANGVESAAPVVTPAPAQPAPAPVAVPEQVAPREPETPPAVAPAEAPPQAAPAPSVAEPAPAAPEPTPVAASVPAPDSNWQAALYTQQMAHQLALAELRNQHLQEQQRLMQQMMDLMQRQLTR